jgi:hypothetical protein
VFAAGRARDPSSVSAVSERGPAVRTRRAALAPTPRLVRALVEIGLAASILMAPVIGWIQVHRAVTSARLSPTAAAAVGAKEAGVDPTVFDRLTRIIPAHATYWIDTAPRIRSSVTRQAFPLWASGALLPRLAVSRPQQADWVVLWGYSPERLRIEVRGVRVLRARSPSGLPVYVAQVVR